MGGVSKAFGGGRTAPPADTLSPQLGTASAGKAANSAGLSASTLSGGRVRRGSFQLSREPSGTRGHPRGQGLVPGAAAAMSEPAAAHRGGRGSAESPGRDGRASEGRGADPSSNPGAAPVALGPRSSMKKDLLIEALSRVHLSAQPQTPAGRNNRQGASLEGSPGPAARRIGSPSVAAQEAQAQQE